ncbi:phosphotransferase [Ornithinibacillus halophilus]|uniref:phosphotransferase n=1 Tax=Ornithinibacillus halophilus TaxID=930117 RepID=UPI001F3059EC|nr:phosphotransferase [Ornithinibacillus halophilus]
MSHQVSNLGGRERHYQRLSSFLYWQGELEVGKMTNIKQDVFLIETHNGKKYILKRHHKMKTVTQQWEFFQKVNSQHLTPFLSFPNNKEILIGENGYWTISPYRNGRKLYYSNPDDRLKALRTIQDFHKEATSIYVNQPIKRKLFYERWYNRLQRFKQTESLFTSYGYPNLFKDISRHTEYYIIQISKYPWQQYQKQAINDGNWVHGDVASHNFILNDEKVWLIDFDLLQNTDQIYDYIQLGQRFLPYINWDVNQLLAYEMVPDKDVKRWLLSVYIPSDLIREWLFYLSKPSKKPIKEFLKDVEMQWLKRKIFLKNAKSVIK